MASGSVCRANRPNTWLHRPARCDAMIFLANSEPFEMAPASTKVRLRFEIGSRHRLYWLTGAGRGG
jgi:hypothetical protein